MGCFGRTMCAVALVAAIPSAAAQRPNCTQRSKFVRYLADTYAEKPGAIGVGDNGGYFYYPNAAAPDSTDISVDQIEADHAHGGQGRPGISSF